MIVLSGCVSFERMSTETRIEEMSWQAIHAVDAAQTYAIVGDPCYIEANKITAAFVGDRPESGRVIVWAIGTSWLHAAVTTWLTDIEADPWLMRTWQAVSFIDVGRAVKNNHDLGIRIGGNNQPSWEC